MRTLNKPKITWSFANLFLETQQETENMRTGFTGFSGSIAASQLIMDNHEIGLYIALSSGIINWLLGGIRIEK